MQIARALTLLAIAFATTISSASAAELQTYKIDLIPPPAGFHERMGGLPKEISLQTFHAAYGTLTIYAYDERNTTLAFDFHGLFPYGVYTLWDVVNPDPANFSDRPLTNPPPGAAGQPHWWESTAFDKDGGPEGFGSFGFMADHRGNARVVVALDHRPGKEFLLDYHADGHVRGGKKGETVFPGVLWATFPSW